MKISKKFFKMSTLLWSLLCLLTACTAQQSSSEDSSASESDASNTETSTSLTLAINQLKEGTNQEEVCGNFFFYLNAQTDTLNLIEIASGTLGKILDLTKDYSPNLAVSADGTIYSVTTAASGAELVLIGLDGSETIMGNTGLTANVFAMTVTPTGELFAIDASDTAHLIDPNTVTTTNLTTADGFNFNGGDVVITEEVKNIYIRSDGTIHELSISADGVVSVTALGNLPTDVSQFYTSAAYIVKDQAIYAFDRTQNKLYSYSLNDATTASIALDIDVNYGDADVCRLPTEVETQITDQQQ